MLQKNRKNWIGKAWLFGLLTIFLVVTGCSAASPSQSMSTEQKPEQAVPQEKQELAFQDSAGTAITVKLPVERVVVLNRNTAEAIKLLGAEQYVLATGDTTIKNNPYLGFDSKPDVGETKQINLEQIISLKPQIVFAYTNRPDKTLEEKLEPAGIKVVRMNNYLPEQMDDELKLLGKIFDKSEKADEFLAWKHSIEKLLADRVAGIREEDKKQVLALSAGFLNTNGGYRIFPSQSLDGKPGVGEGYATILAGGKDAADLQWNPAEASTTIMVDEEYVLKRNPEVITLHGTWLGGYNVKDTKPFEEALRHIMSTTSVSRLKAGQTKDIYFFYTNFAGSDKRYIGNLQLAKYLYPDKFQDIDPEQYAKEYFEKWLGVPYQGIWHYSFKDVQ
ncbi:ABC transporter substrate-binding protein [Brevibacillus parabrevis]|uniref:ABC transporter substrate-binding protein n=1 Tax=Brevibacillus parabrevis TaxID=54914 RepID=UPI0007AB89F2|nr:ABC transporter substrate-binding protein [Brevibacillus parabrevis]KZE43388.1 ABC transporter substrate-binding protein [Brevibacillus parabrevis]